jgi:hypothetical protein
MKKTYFGDVRIVRWWLCVTLVYKLALLLSFLYRHAPLCKKSLGLIADRRGTVRRTNTRSRHHLSNLEFAEVSVHAPRKLIQVSWHTLMHLPH